ncbi:hypothetical protein JNM05_03890 [bacterium]|nr:hypothetical protein [bacterium]
MKFQKYKAAYILSTIIFLGFGCDISSPDSLLKQKYDVVMGILAPDSANSYSRPYQTEVCVGPNDSYGY